MHKADMHLIKWPLFLIFAVALNGALWFSVRDVQPRWANVPPVPSTFSAAFTGLGDPQLAYRALGLSVQNFGDIGGRTTNLAEYDYETLAGWMRLEHTLDPISNFTPALAGFFFGGNKDHTALGPIVDYLEVAGRVDHPQKWRWLVQASFLAKHKMKDLDRALEIAQELAAIEEEGMPSWTKQMPVFVMNQQGEKEAALELMLQLIKSEGEHLHPNEVNAMKAYICEQIFTPEEAEIHALCGEIY